MSRRIFTYNDLTQLAENPVFLKIKSQPIVTVSADLRKSLKGVERIDKVKGLFADDDSVRVVEFRAFAEGIDTKWNTDQSKFNQMIVLSEFIRKKAAKADDKEKNYYLGCKRNINSVLAAISLLEQAQIRPDGLYAGTDKNLAVLIEAWKYLVENDKSILRFREKMSGMVLRDNWGPIFDKCFNLIDPASVKRITFMNFYYITPYQESVMRLLEKAGFELDFLIPYDERYPFVYEIWDETYSVVRGYPDKADWCMEKSVRADSYADIFYGKKVSVDNKISIKEYASVIEYVNEIKKIKSSGTAVYSAEFKKSNDLLKEYYPEMYGERKTLSYPIGQFISNLCKMWDDDRNTVIIEKDRLIECFASGWLSLDGQSGRQYLQELMYVLPFFDGCTTIDEWEKRLAILKNIDDNIISKFRMELSADAAVARWQEACANPLISFSPFSVPKETLDILMSLIKQLFEMARELYQDNKASDVKTYMGTLDRVLKGHEISDELYEQEIEIVKDIFVKLYQSGEINFTCHPADIANALSLFISGKLEDGEVDPKSVGMVYPFYFVDAACVKNDSKIHVCMCDVSSMPGGDKDYVWPLSEECIRKTYENTGNTLIENMMQIMSSNAVCNRFFMYSALKNKEVCLSWISDMNDKLNAPSPYIKLICDATGIEISPAKRNTVTYRRVEEAVRGDGKIKEYDKSKAPVEIIKEARMAYALCPMKYVLSYVVDKYPTYESSFQQNYAINALISAIYDLLSDENITKEEVYKNVLSLFPNLRKVEKRQIKDYMSYDRGEKDFNYGDRTEKGGLFYADERIKVHYPNKDVRGVAINRYSKLGSPDGRRGLNLFERMKPDDDERLKNLGEAVESSCTFCPHIDSCINAIHSVDQEKYYD